MRTPALVESRALERPKNAPPLPEPPADVRRAIAAVIDDRKYADAERPLRPIDRRRVSAGDFASCGHQLGA